MRLQFIHHWNIKRTAKKLTDIAAREGCPTTDNLLKATGILTGLEKITCELDDLNPGAVASTRISGNIAQIRISRSCTTFRHTLAHELGHLALGHSLVDTKCFENDLEDCPPGFERLYLAMVPDAAIDVSQSPEEDGYSAYLIEQEAELFASEILTILPGIRASNPAGEWLYGLA